jgi:hypothetical protein
LHWSGDLSEPAANSNLSGGFSTTLTASGANVYSVRTRPTNRVAGEAEDSVEQKG